MAYRRDRFAVWACNWILNHVATPWYRDLIPLSSPRVLRNSFQMKILATSDLHGHLPEIPSCDLLIIAGDICPDGDIFLHQYRFLEGPFARWLSEIPANHVIGIAGNHDFIFESHPRHIDKLDLSWDYLQDSATTYQGLKFYGLPWVPDLPGWAFYAPKASLAMRYNAIPNDTDVVISHGPPYGLGDLSINGNVHCGSKSANDMLARVKPQAFVCGHIHEGFGVYTHRSQHGHLTDVWNVAYLDRNYQRRPIANPIIEIVIDGNQEEQETKQRKVRDSRADSRLASEPIGGHESVGVSGDDEAVAETHSLDAHRRAA